MSLSNKSTEIILALDLGLWISLSFEILFKNSTILVVNSGFN